MMAVKVPALERAQRVIDYIAQRAEPPTAGEIGAALGMAKSSLHALLHTLTALGWLNRDAANAYHLGNQLRLWAQAMPNRHDVVTCFHEVSERLPALNRYTLTLTMLDGSEVVYLACRESVDPLGFAFRLGMRLPAIFTATGKAMLATFSDSALDAFLHAQPWPAALTAHGVSNPAALKQELQHVRRDGYSLDNGQVRAGMYCVGVAIPAPEGHSHNGIAVSLLEHEASAAELQRCGDALRRIAAELQTQLMSQ